MGKVILISLMFFTASCAVRTVIQPVEEAQKVFIPTECEKSLRGMSEKQLVTLFGEPEDKESRINYRAYSFKSWLLSRSKSVYQDVVVIVQGDRVVDAYCRVRINL